MSAHIKTWQVRLLENGNMGNEAHFMQAEIADLRARVAELEAELKDALVSSGLANLALEQSAAKLQQADDYIEKLEAARPTGQAATTASASLHELKQKLAEAIGEGNSITIHGLPAPRREAALDDPKMAAYLRNEPWIAAYIETLECELRKAQAAHAGAEEKQTQQAHVMPPVAAPVSQHDADDQWIFDLAAEHEVRPSPLFGPVAFSSTGILNFARAIKSEVATRFAQGGVTSNEAADTQAARAAVPFFNIIPTLTKEKEAAAERGICPDCGTPDLHHINSAEGMRFFQCGKCKDLVVLGFAPSAAQEGKQASAPADEECSLCDGMGFIDGAGSICPHCDGSGTEPAGGKGSA
jgi:hypothetical protein